MRLEGRPEGTCCKTGLELDALDGEVKKGLVVCAGMWDWSDDDLRGSRQRVGWPERRPA